MTIGAKRKLWEKCVSQGQEITRLLKLKTIHRMKLAELALKVSEVKHGGRVHQDAGTVVKFAIAVGINRQTLYEWIKIKQTVMDKLSEHQMAESEGLPYAVVMAVRAKVKPDDPPEVVQEVWSEEAVRPKDNAKFKKYLSRMKSIIHNAQNPKVMQDVDTEDIEEMIKRCGLVINLLRQEIEIRDKYDAEGGERFKVVRTDARKVWDEVDDL